MLLLDTWYLTLDIWHRYLTYYYLTPDTWHLISDTVLDILLLDTWYMTHNNWHAITHLTCFHMVLVHFTWCCDTWLKTITPDTCTTLHIHDYHFYGGLTWLLYCYQIFATPELLCSWTPELLYTWTPETGRLLTLCSWYIILLLIPVIG